MYVQRPIDYLTLIASAPDQEITPAQIVDFCDMVPGIDKRPWANSSREWYQKMLTKGTLADENRVGVISDETLREFGVWLQHTSGYENIVEVRLGRVVPKLTTDMYRLWDAVHVWGLARSNHCGKRCDNGWFRHAIRLAARYQWTRLGQTANRVATYSLRRLADPYSSPRAKAEDREGGGKGRRRRSRGRERRRSRKRRGAGKGGGTE